ncbi:MAG TPA: STAS domain-containing protein [Bacteroidia bacterium]
MKINVQKEEKYTVIRPEIEKLDSTVAALMKSEIVLITGNGEKNLIIDLSDVKYIDSSGLSALLVANRSCKSVNGSFVLTGLHDNVNKLIKISQLDTILTITPTFTEAHDYIIMDDLQKSL